MDSAVATSPPAAQRAELLRRRIIDAARKVFAQKGYERTSTDAVAAAVPVSKRTLYNYFSSKEELFQAVITASWSWLLSPSSVLLEVAPVNHGDAVATLESYGESVVAHWTNPGVAEMIRLVIAEAHRFPEIAAAFMRHGKEPAVNRLAAFLTRVDEAGITRISEPRVLAWQFHGMLKETVFLPTALGVPLPFPPEKSIEMAVQSTLCRSRHVG